MFCVFRHDLGWDWVEGRIQSGCGGCLVGCVRGAVFRRLSNNSRVTRCVVLFRYIVYHIGLVSN